MKRHAVSSISLPVRLLAEATEFARREKRPRSDVVREALAQYLDAKRWKELQAVGARAAKRLGITTMEQVDDLIHEYRRELRK